MNQHVKHRCSRSAHGRVLFTFGVETECQIAGGGASVGGGILQEGGALFGAVLRTTNT